MANHPCGGADRRRRRNLQTLALLGIGGGGSKRSATSSNLAAKRLVKTDRVLMEGDYGTDVEDLQVVLTQAGYYTFAGGPTGYFGFVTKEAVEAWQADRGVPATGNFGVMSKEVLSRETRAAAKRKERRKEKKDEPAAPRSAPPVVEPEAPAVVAPVTPAPPVRAAPTPTPSAAVQQAKQYADMPDSYSSPSTTTSVATALGCVAVALLTAAGVNRALTGGGGAAASSMDLEPEDVEAELMEDRRRQVKRFTSMIDTDRNGGPAVPVSKRAKMEERKQGGPIRQKLPGVE